MLRSRTHWLIKLKLQRRSSRKTTLPQPLRRAIVRQPLDSNATLRQEPDYMSYPLPPDVEEMVRQRMASGKYPSEGDLFREALQALSEEEQDLAAIQEAVAEWRAGDSGIPLDEAFDALRTKYAVRSDG
jgi:putative addiction module CopG family antidote